VAPLCANVGVPRTATRQQAAMIGELARMKILLGNVRGG